MISNGMKRIFTLALLLLLSLSAAAQRPKVGVVLCGGGAKGAAHVGVLKVLEENGIPIDCIAGTSMGAIVGGLYAIGYKADDLDSLIMAQDWNFVMSDRIPRSSRLFERKQDQSKYLLEIPFGAGDYSRLSARNPQRKPEEVSFLSNIPISVFNGQNIYNLFTRLSVGYQDSLDFNRMPIPFACVAVDLVKKEEVVFHEGRFVDAIRSSMAIPGYFSPVRIDDKVLVDGGVLNNFPVDVCRAMGADIVIGVLLGDPDPEEPVVDNIGEMASQIMNLYMDTKLPDAIANTDLLIRPSTKGYNVLSFDTASLRALIQNGETAARDKQDEITALKDWLDRSTQHFIGPIKQAERYRKAIRLDRDSITLGSVSFNGIAAKDFQWLLRKSPLKPGARISGRDLDSEVARFYNTAAFESVTYTLHGQTDPYDLVLNFVPGRKSVLGVGVRFDSEEIAAILLGVGFNENALYGSKFNITAKLAYNMQASFRYAYAFRSLAQVKAGYQFRSSTMGISSLDATANIGLKQHSLSAAFATKARNISIDLGARMDFFRYNGQLSFDEMPNYDIDFSRNAFPTAFARFQADSRDDAYFPRKGNQLDAEFGYCFNRLIKDDYGNFMTARFHFSSVIPAGQRLAFIATVDNRTLIGSDIPMAYANVMGGYLPGRYMDQQIPFMGFTEPRLFQNVLTSVSLDSRYRILDNHYVFLSGAYARDFQNFKTIFEHKPIIGARLGYAYNSFLGPLAFNLFWSNHTHSVGVYLSVGYNF